MNINNLNFLRQKMHVVNHFSQILLILNVQVDYYTLQVYSGTLITFVSLHDLNTPEKKHGVKHHFITPNQTVALVHHSGSQPGHARASYGN